MMETARTKRILSLRLFLIVVVAVLGLSAILTSQRAQAALPGFYVQGRFLYDEYGQKFIPYGINHMIYWTDLDGVPSYAEMAKTGANTVRIQWLTPGTADQLDTAITNCRANRMVPMPELHDATGDWAKLPQLVDYWVRPDIVAVIQKHQDYLLLNIGNEVGQSVSDADYISGYTTAVTRMRNAGIHVPIVIDAAAYGQDINGLQRNGPTLIQNDPDHNLIFSVHMWWPYMWGHTDQEVVDEIAESVNMNLPLIIGEFGNKWDESATGGIPYKTIIREAYLNQVGYLPWSWGPGNNPQTWLDMTTDQTYATLRDWGMEVAVTDQYSIKNIAVRPAWLNNVPPTPVPTSVPPNLISYNKPVTVSSVETGNGGTNVGANVVDGSMGTRWASQNSDPQWITVDLGGPTAVSTADLVWEAAYATQYRLQISNDAATWIDVLTEYNGNGGTDTIAVNQTTRYVRMYGTQRVNSEWGYSMWEFRVWSGGTPPPTTPPPTTPPPTTPPPTTPAVTTPPPTTQAGQAPYGGTPWAIPGTVQAENYDTGGEGVAYHDTTSGNSGNTYRTTERVDVQSTTDSGGGYNVGWTAAGEWLEYTVNVAVGGTYTLNVRVASQSGGGTIHVEFDGVNATGAVTLPSTGGWQTWTTVTRTGISLSAGRHVMRIALDSGAFNINWVSFTGGGTPPVTTPPPTTPPPTTPPPTTPPPTTPPPTTPPATTPPATTPPPTTPPPTGGPACSPVTSTITVPFTFDGAGTFCWQTNNLGTYINSWNLASLTINGVDFTNRWVGSGSYPPAINGSWYISYQGNFSWSHFEAK